MFSILVPLDGSKLAEEVLPHVEAVARALHAEVHFLQVIDVSTRVVGARGDEVPGNVLTMTDMRSEKNRVLAEEYLAGLASAWQAKDIDAKWEVAEGRAATKIVEVARTREVTIIAMSTHGRSGLGQLVFGSVANEVLREGGIPLLLVRPSHSQLSPE